MTEREEHIGCIDGRILSVRLGSDEVVLRIGGSEASLSLDAAGLLAHHLSPEPLPPNAPEGPPQLDTPYERLRPQVWDRIIHLIEADLIRVGTVITLTHHGVEHHATITAEGHIAIDEHAFESPSPAAKHLTNTSVNGWRAWRVIDGPSLIDLRWRLRAKRFLGDSHPYSEATIKQKRTIARRWVEYAIANKLDPGQRNEGAVEEMLSERSYAWSTLVAYRGHLEQWFVQWDSSQGTRS